MKNEILDPAFYPFFMEKLQERLSGSSVMPIDQAERIQQSIAFVLENGNEGSLPERFEQGKEQLKQRLARLKTLYLTIKENYQSFGIESLEESLEEIGHFFTTYDLDYGAAEVDQAFLDYQLAEAVPANYVGIEFYECYLHNLAAEVFFLKSIPSVQIYELLDQYQQKLGFDYRQDVNNLFEIVYRQMIGKLLIGKNQNTTLLFNRIEAQYAFGRIKNENTPPELNQLFERSDYYHRIYQQFQVTVRQLKEAESAVHFFITTTPRKKQLELPPTMPAAAFNRLLEAYSAADYEGKIRLITTNISAPADFEEYLNFSPEKPEFYKRLFKELNKNFIMTLFLYFRKEYDYKMDVGNIDAKANDGVLHLLKDYLKSLSKKERFELFAIIDEYQLVPNDYS